MKFISYLILSSLLIFSVSCSSTSNINGSSIRTATLSAGILKGRLPIRERIEFEVSYWSIREDIRDDTGFLSIVDGKSPEEIVTLGVQIFNARKESGFKAYDKYEDWDQMIDVLATERIVSRKKSSISHRTNRKNNVLYTV